MTAEPPIGSYACGEVFGSENFENGTRITTSQIVSCRDDKITTASGSTYTLVGINPDYAEFLHQGTDKVITCWWFQRRECNDSYEGEEVVLSGYINDNHLINGYVIAQRGNFVTLRVADPDTSKISDKEYFVLWRNMSLITQGDIFFKGEHGGLSYDRYFEEAFGFKCRPKIPITSG